jgi:hypothetical protein
MKTTDFKYFVIVMTLTLATACTKVVDLKLGNDTGKLVIEGNVTNKRGAQFIKLSRNVAFTATNIYPTVTGATVSVSDTTGKIFPFIEGPAGIYSINSMAGTAGRTYKMNIATNGSVYTANSQMPRAVKLDSITEKVDAFDKKNNRRQITVHFQDPAGTPNQYRFILTVNGVEVKRIFAFNDDFSDGRYVNLDLFQNDIDIIPGNTVTVEMQCVDKTIYTYWFTLMREGNGFGGGVAPSNPPTNIKPVALGYFSAHTTQSLILKVN